MVLMVNGKFNPRRRKPAEPAEVQDLLFVCTQLKLAGFSIVSSREATDSESTEIVAMSNEANGRAVLDQLAHALNGRVQYDGWAYLQNDMSCSLIGRAPSF